jgi:hypothetical protein
MLKVKAIGVSALSNFTHGKLYEVEEHIPAKWEDSAGGQAPEAYIIRNDQGFLAYVYASRFESIN